MMPSFGKTRNLSYLFESGTGGMSCTSNLNNGQDLAVPCVLTFSI